MDKTGRIVIAPRFVWANGFEHGKASVMICGGSALINSSGDIVDPPRMHRPWLNEGLGPFQGKNGKFGFKGPDGKTEIEPKFDEVGEFSEGVAPVRLGDKWGYIDHFGSVLSPVVYQSAFRFQNGYAWVTDANGEDHLIDHKFVYRFDRGDWAHSLPSDGLLLASIHERYGYVRADGSWAINPRFKKAKEFQHGLAPASLDGEHFGYIDLNGKFAIPPQFDDADTFSNGLAAVKIGRQYGVIDEAGKFTIPLSDLDWIAGFDENGISPATSRNGEESGYIDRFGRRLFWTTEGNIMFTHAPLGGWSSQEVHASCEGLEKVYPDVLKAALAEARGW